jgi:NAD(P)-dependent dehydrogenase (short-subunit alcohol dehydrogenase family)
LASERNREEQRVDRRLAGKVAVVTGAGSGLGLASAQRFAAEGAAVVCADLGDGGERAAETIAAAGGRALGAVVDVSSADDLAAMVDTASELLGGIDVLYANAGVPGEGKATDVDPADWERMLAVNLTGVFLSARAVLPAMAARGGGCLITQASAAGLVALPALAPYSAAKAGVIGLTRQLALDYAPHRVRVNAICPGTVVTPLVEAAMERRGGVEQGLEHARARIPLGRLGEPDEIAGLATFLASDEGSWITGAAIPIDGGLTLAARIHH